MVILLKLIFKFNTTSIKIPAAIFTENDKMILNLLRKYKEPRMDKTILKKNELVNFILCNFKIYYKNYSNKDNVVLTHG